MAVRTSTPVWTLRPQVVAPEPQEGGRPRTKVRLAEGAPFAMTVKEVVARWPEGHWQSLAVAEGEKGLIYYDWACQPVVESRDGLPGVVAYYLSNAPADMPLLKLAQVASLRYAVEQCIEEAKSETGLDEYEVRYWHSWHRHITLSMMAHAWLASIRCQATEKKGPEPFLAELTVPEVRRLLEVALPLPYRSRELRLAWSFWRGAKRWQARLSHSRRQAIAWRLRLKPTAGSPAQLRL